MSFDKEELGKFATDCLRPYFLEELDTILKTKLFSFSIDNSTICGKNYCALKVKYLTAQKDEEYKCEITTVQNKVIGISKLAENATSETLYKIVQEKLLYDADIKKNCIGITHDRGSNLVGSRNGLIQKIKKDWDENKNLFSLNDPCHSLNLVLKHSIQTLPKAMLNFIIRIHNHFVSPERRATLLRIQAANNQPCLYPKKWIKTRWLSLGETLNRLLKIWNSLTLYMENNLPKSYKNGSERTNSPEQGITNPKIKEDKETEEEVEEAEFESEEEDLSLASFNAQDCHKLLVSKSFHIKMIFFSHLIGVLNNFNILFQDQSMEVFKVRQEIENIFNYFCLLSVIPSKRNTLIDDRLKLDWSSTNVQKDYFYDTENFIMNLRTIISKDEFACFEKLEKAERDDFGKVFLDFIAKVLNLLKHYLPFEDVIVSNLDFIALIDSEKKPFMQKIVDFNESFKIIEINDVPKLSLEAMSLCSRIPHYLSLKRVKNSFHLWDIIQQSERFKYLPKVVSAAQTLPTSSSAIEQTFSVMGLFKNEKRSQLSPEGLEALLLLHQNYPFGKTFQVTDELIQKYKEVKQTLNTRKNRFRQLQKQFIKEDLDDMFKDEGITSPPLKEKKLYKLDCQSENSNQSSQIEISMTK